MSWNNQIGTVEHSWDVVARTKVVGTISLIKCHYTVHPEESNVGVEIVETVES